MNIKYHNKVEICVGDRTYVAYNKVLNSLYSKIVNFESYADYFSLGTGKSSVDVSASKLGSYLMSIPCVTTEISCNPENGVYFVKKTATIDSNDSETFSFSEIGISSENSTNADIYNHILITDENGDVIDVVKNAGESLVINMTIFLDLSVEDNTFLSLGDNNLIKLLLGEKLVDKTIYAVRGTNMSDNIPQARVYPRFDKKYKANISSILTDNGAELNIITKLGEGATREIVFIINNEVVARKNIMEFRPSISILNTVTSSNRGSAIVDENVSDVISVYDENGNTLDNILYKNIAKSLGDEIVCEDITDFDNETTRFESLDGKHIAFLTDNNVVLLESNNYALTRIHTGAINVSGIYKICMMNDFVFVFKNISPYIEIYRIINKICVKQEFYKVNYDQSVYSYDYKDTCVTILNSGDILISAILNTSSIGIVLRVREDEDGFNLVSITQSSLSVVEKVIPVIKTNLTDGKILMITGKHNDELAPYCMEIFSSNNSGIGYYSQAEEFMNATKVTSHGDYLLIHNNVSPYIYSFDTTNFNRKSFPDNSFNGDGIASSYMDYILSSSSENKKILYYCLDQEFLTQFETDYFSKIGDDNIIDVVILDCMLIIFTNSETQKIKVVLLDKTLTQIYNLPVINKNYKVSYNKFDLLGTHEYEGVQVNLNFKF